jgi:hypothetical protein
MMAPPVADDIKQAQTCTKPPVMIAADLQETPVKIVVGTGDEAVTYHLPPTPLMHASRYFRACLSHDFVERAEHIVNLRHADPAVFRFFVEWLLGIGKLDGKVLEISQLVGLWVLGDSIMCEGLQNQAMDTLRARNLFYTGGSWGNSAGKILFDRLASVVEHAGETSMLISYAMDKIAYAMVGGLKLRDLLKSDGYWAKLPDKITAELFLRYQHYVELGSKGEDPAKGGGCCYHVHDDDKAGNHQTDEASDDEEEGDTSKDAKA